MEVKNGKYTMVQAENHHVMIFKRKRMIAHIEYERALTEEELKHAYDDILEIQKQNEKLIKEELRKRNRLWKWWHRLKRGRENK